MLFASLAEGAALAGASDPAEMAARVDAGTLVLTLGADGVRVDGEHVPAVTAPVVLDPTGAGDAFCAGFLAHWLRDGDAVAAARAGAEVAARARRARRRATLLVPASRRRWPTSSRRHAVDFTDDSTFVSVCFASPRTIDTFGS